MSAISVPQMTDIDVPVSIRSAVNKHISASFRVFDALEPYNGDTSNSSGQPEKHRLIDASTMFRNNISLFASEIGGIADSLFSADNNIDDFLIASLDRTLDMTNRMEGIWNLCEIFFLRSPSSCFFEMAQWLQVYFP